MPVCMCPCVFEGLWHTCLLDYWSVLAHGEPCALGRGREAREPDAKPAGGDVGLASQPARQKDKLPNCSTIACRHGKAVVCGMTRVRPALLDFLWHRWCCHVDWVWLPMA